MKKKDDQGPDRELAERIVALLNELVALDAPAVAALIANRVPCNQALADHPTVQCAAQHGGFNVGLLGILNGICGTYPSSLWGCISAEFDGPGPLRNLTGFKVLTEDEVGAATTLPRGARR